MGGDGERGMTWMTNKEGENRTAGGDHTIRGCGIVGISAT